MTTYYAVKIKVTDGAGHVDLSALSTENENITCKLSGEIGQFTPAGSNTVLKAAGG